MVVVYRHREHAADPKPKPKPKPKPSSLVVVVYRHREHAGALGLLARVEARHVRVLERLVRDRGCGCGFGVDARPMHGCLSAWTFGAWEVASCTYRE